MPGTVAWDRLLAPLLHGSGVYRRRWRAAAESAPRAVVLTYHRIARPGDAAEDLLFGVERGLDAASFEAHLRFMRRDFAPVRAADLFEDPERLPRLAFAVTFDDGYRDNLLVAAPILRRLGIPATIYVTTDYIGSDRRFWWEQLGALLRGCAPASLEPRAVLPELAPELPQTLPVRDRRSRARAHWILSDVLAQRASDAIPGCLARLADCLGTPLESERRDTALLSWDEVRAIQDLGFDVGAHGATHANLGAAEPDEAEREVRRSVERIAAETSHPAETFAYPYGGRRQRSPAAVRAIRASGCRGAFTTERGVVDPATDRFAAPRVGLTRGNAFACAYKTDLAFRASAESRSRARPREGRGSAPTVT